MSIEQLLCKVKKIQLQSISNAIRCIDHRFAFKNYAIACIQPELSEIDNSAPKKAVRNSSSNMTIHIPFFSSNCYEPMAEWLRLVVDSLETRVRLLHSAESFCPRSSHFAWH